MHRSGVGGDEHPQPRQGSRQAARGRHVQRREPWIHRLTVGLRKNFHRHRLGRQLQERCPELPPVLTVHGLQAGRVPKEAHGLGAGGVDAARLERRSDYLTPRSALLGIKRIPQRHVAGLVGHAQRLVQQKHRLHGAMRGRLRLRHGMGKADPLVIGGEPQPKPRPAKAQDDPAAG